MLWLAICIGVRLRLVASITSQTALEVVILTLTANPASVWKFEVFLAALALTSASLAYFVIFLWFFSSHWVIRVTFSLLGVVILAFSSIFLFLLILAPFWASCVIRIFFTLLRCIWRLIKTMLILLPFGVFTAKLTWALRRRGLFALIDRCLVRRARIGDETCRRRVESHLLLNELDRLSHVDQILIDC